MRIPIITEYLELKKEHTQVLNELHRVMQPKVILPPEQVLACKTCGECNCEQPYFELPIKKVKPNGKEKDS